MNWQLVDFEVIDS